MEKYKKIVAIRICFLTIGALFAVGLGIFNVFFATSEIKASEVFGFQCGLAVGLGFLAIILIMRYSKALRNDKALQIQYNKENDERMKTIRAKAGMPMLLISSILMIGVGLLISYSNFVAFYTLIAAAIVQMVMACMVKFIYTRLM